MSNKILNLSFLVLVLFLTSIVLPPDLLSYEKESVPVEGPKIFQPATFQKVRCPNCGMEFFYAPGKDGLYTSWVLHLISEPESSVETEVSLPEGSKEKVTKEKVTKEKVLNMIDLKKEEPARFEVEKPKFKLFQLLTCPYDGYKFYPEKEKIAEVSFTKEISQVPSVIEASFTKNIPFAVSKDLNQFGYELFAAPIEPGIEPMAEEREPAATTFGKLKSAFIAESEIGLDRGSFLPTVTIPVNPDYILGPGDTLIINIWGSVQESFPVTIDAEGKILLPKAGPLYLWGLKFEEAENQIRERLNQFYTNFNVDVSMGRLRSIRVFVLGEVKKPGAYVLGSQSTVFHGLYAAGGPTKLGTLRRIKLSRSNGTQQEIDLYPLLLKGDKTQDPRLQPEDTIFVPPIGDVVGIAGNVKKPSIYETRSEILLSDLMEISGGITPVGNLQRLQVERIKDQERRIMLDMELKTLPSGEVSFKDISLKNGDLVLVSPIVRLRHNFVTVVGNVENPGDYGLTKDMTVSDLVDRAKGFLPGTYFPRAEIARVSVERTREIIPIDLHNVMAGDKAEDLRLAEWDILLVYSESDVKPSAFVEIDGAVNKPGQYELSPNMKVSDLIFKAGGIKAGEVVKIGELFHIIPGEQPVVRDIKLIKKDNRTIVDKDIFLKEGDKLFIRSEPKLTEKKLVAIEGEVRFPGEYAIREGETISSLIERAGGFTKDAFLDGAVFTRQSIKEAQEKMRQAFLERENRAILEEQQALSLRAGEAIDVAKIAESLRIRKEIVDMIASAEIEGRMVIKLQTPQDLRGTKYDILLENGDAIRVPQIPSAVTVMGSVNNPTSVPYEEKRGIEYYIQKTGGLTRHADKSGVYVIRANGEALSKFMMAKEVKRGDTIVVPQEFKYWTPPGTLLKDAVQMLSQVALGIGIIAALD